MGDITVKNFNFRNQTERTFCEYLLSRQYAKNTVRHYIAKLRRIKPLNQLVQEALDPYIADYETGANENANKRSHNDTSNALKRFREHQAHLGITVA